MLNSEKVGEFIKKIRKDNNLTQNDFAQKYGVSYQAVSKWENGINLPDVSLLKEICNDYNISIDDLLDGNYKKKNNKLLIIPIIIIVVGIFIIIYSLILKNNNTFNFKTITTSCKEFNVSGSIAYDKVKSSIYISHIDYCGGDDTTKYKEINCMLYEKNDNNITLISSFKKSNNITLEDYLKDIELKIDDYKQACKNYKDDSLFLEINATKHDDKTITYKIPLKLNDNC